MIISKKSIRARAQQDAASAVDGDAPALVYPDNPDAQTEYEDAYLRATNAADAEVAA